MTRDEATYFYWRQYGHELGEFQKEVGSSWFAWCIAIDCDGWYRWYDDETTEFLGVPCLRSSFHPSRNITVA
jgi:hypothetical protein